MSPGAERVTWQCPGCGDTIVRHLAAIPIISIERYCSPHCWNLDHGEEIEPEDERGLTEAYDE